MKPSLPKPGQRASLQGKPVVVKKIERWCGQVVIVYTTAGSTQEHSLSLSSWEAATRRPRGGE